MKKVFVLIMALAQINCLGQGRYKSPWERFNKTLSVDLGAGTAHYFGDIHPTNNLYSFSSTVRWNVSSNLTWQFSPFFSLRTGFAWVRIAGDDFVFAKNNMNARPTADAFDLQFLRNLHFRNDIKEFSLVGIINLSNGFSNRTSNRPNQTPYLFSGINLFINQPMAREKYNVSTSSKGDWTNINISPSNSKLNFSIPIGLGFRRKLNSKLDLVAEISYRVTFIDNLDDIIKGPYSNANTALENRSTERVAAQTGQDRTLTFNEISNRLGFPSSSGTGPNLPPTIGFPNPFPERGNDKNDSYWTTSLRVRYYFEKKIKCK
ncbi:MAG: DUF6089 family protein [Emticicia sp.]|uniref:DUF6089 family protein n=1 Tax=Emticicia sp. TaxID=1930953 RepID=UPI003BA77F9B